ncbi:MAG: acyl-CoA/acyl-ACP dehydrogenase [Myxococcales bacterium]|nr:acyl-CoA/acyl-ACP dehydrogenase [Myxococcales bacterium]
MDFEFSEEQEQLRETVRRFLEERAPIETVRSLLDDPRGTTDELWKGTVQLGLPGLLIPEAFGGGGGGMLEMGVVLEEMGRHLHPGPYLSSALSAVALLRAAGTDDARERWFPALADGSLVATVALFEAGQRYEWRTPTLRSVDAGERCLLSGEKSFVPDLAAADVCFVTAATDDGTGIFGVECNAAGVETLPLPSIDGTRHHGTLRLDAAEARRVDAGGATDGIATALDFIHVGTVADGVGAATRAFELALEYARQREQFGTTIGSFQAVQHLLTDMLTELELGRAAAYYALWAADADPDDRRRTSILAKAFACQAFPRIAEDAIQIFGGVGYTWEYDIHLYYKRLLTLRHTFGGVTESLDELASIILD